MVTRMFHFLHETTCSKLLELDNSARMYVQIIKGYVLYKVKSL